MQKKICRFFFLVTSEKAAIFLYPNIKFNWSDHKKSSVKLHGTFFFEKTGCLLDLLKKQRAKHTQNRVKESAKLLLLLLCHTYEVSCRARNERLSPRLLIINASPPCFMKNERNHKTFGSPALFLE